MHTAFLAPIRAHAHALGQLARKLSEPAVAAEFEGLALNLLKRAHDYEIQARR